MFMITMLRREAAELLNSTFFFNKESKLRKTEYLSDEMLFITFNYLVIEMRTRSLHNIVVCYY